MNKECSVDVLKVKYDAIEDFTLHLWQRSKDRSLVFFIFVCFVLAYCYAIIIWLVCTMFLDHHSNPLIYLHTWANLIYISSWEVAFMYMLQYHQPRPEGENVGSFTSVLYKSYWLLFSTALTLLVLSFVIFWTQAYDGATEVAIDIVMCNVTPFLAICHFTLVSFPLRLLYVVIPDFFICLYVLFNFGYYKLGGHGRNGSQFVYKYLDWSSSKKAALTVCLCFVIANASYVVLWFVKLLLLKYRKKILFA